MDANNTSVELIRLEYYTSEDYDNITTVSQSVYVQEPPKKQKTRCLGSIFGHKWINKVGGHCGDDENKYQWSLSALLVVVVVCSVVAVVCGINFTLAILANKTVAEDSTNIPNNSSILITKMLNVESLLEIKANKTLNTTTQIPYIEEELDLESSYEFCQYCISPLNVCLVLTLGGFPTCVASIDIDDLTGCGGHCTTKASYCKLLYTEPTEHVVHQCLTIYPTYKCEYERIPLTKVCDGIIDCPRGTDELNCGCNLNSHFKCDENASCLKNDRKCDGKLDCWDESDEPPECEV